ncbi:MAG: TRAP transporter small permease [Spirochaetes bacterium]|nr:TRAP transporter small permease [Spirochaetota bacterium]
MQRFEKILISITNGFNWVAAAAVLIMMTVTVLDVILRAFKSPLPGVFEIVGMLGAVAISFSLAYTSVEKGHIAVEILVQKLSERAQALLSALYSLAGLFLFLLAAWVCSDFALDLMRSGEVSLTIKMPTYPFVFGISLGSLLLSFVLFMDMVKSLRELRRK